MSQFTKTIIVDSDHDRVVGEYYKTIMDATYYFISNSIGGTIIVESGEYFIDGRYEEEGLNDKRTIRILSYTTLIGRGNVVVKVTNPNQNAFRNFHINDDVNKDSNIILSGFKIVIACGYYNKYENHLIFMQNVSNSRFEKLTIDAPTATYAPKKI
jgi:hypothetical protein